jgi:hypothetical protein
VQCAYRIVGIGSPGGNRYAPPHSNYGRGLGLVGGHTFIIPMSGTFWDTQYLYRRVRFAAREPTAGPLCQELVLCTEYSTRLCVTSAWFPSVS